MKLCKDCRYFKPDSLGLEYGGSPKCKHELSVENVDHVHGYEYYSDCYVMRGNDSCGSQAKLFEQGGIFKTMFMKVFQ